MGLTKKLKSMAIEAYLSEPARLARGRIDSLERRIRGRAPRAELYLQADDPYSYLLAQAVDRLRRRYPIEWDLHLVAAPPADVAPAPELRRKHALRDAAELARHYDLEFPAVKKHPDQNPVQRASAVITFQRPFDEQIEATLAVLGALWSGDAKQLEVVRTRYRFEATGTVAPRAHSGYQRLRDRGHYIGGTIRYGGEWFQGIERLPYLEDRLRADFDRPGEPSVLQLRSETEAAAAAPAADDDGSTALRFWFSFRSPYSYLAVDRVLAFAQKYPVRIIFKPVAPMVSRGVPLPRAKMLYLARDAKREADRLGLPFGKLCDPLGQGVENCLAIFQLAQRTEKAGSFLQSATRGIWSEGLDMADENDLRRVVERAGLDWQAAREAMTDDGWRQVTADNAEELEKLELWGVPSFALGDYATWGQDRLPLIERKLRALARGPGSDSSSVA